MKRTPQPPQISVFFLRKVYQAYLNHLLPASTIEVWSNALQHSGTGMNIKEFLLHVWAGRGHVNWPVLSIVMDPLERFAAENDIDPVTFFSEHVFSSAGSLILPPADALRLADSWLPDFFTRPPHELLLEKVEPTNAVLTPGTRHHITNKVSRGNTAYCYLRFECESRFHPSYDAVFTNAFQQGSAAAAAIPPYHEVRILAEKRSIESIVSLYGTLIDPLAVKKSIVGTTMGEAFDNEELGLSSRERDARVALAKSDVFTRSGKVRVLRKGRVYGAPCGVTRIAYHTSVRTRVSFRKILDVIFSKEGRDWNERMRKRHLAVIDSLRHEYRFVFDSSRAELFVNSRPLASGISARVIAAMIKAHHELGTREFSNGFFQADTLIVKSKLDKSLNIHLKRALQHVHKKAPLVTLTRETGSGLVRLSLRCDISYREVSSLNRTQSA